MLEKGGPIVMLDPRRLPSGGAPHVVKHKEAMCPYIAQRMLGFEKTPLT
jgi:hypothetical protein